MGEIGEEDLMNWDKLHGNGMGEKILVFVRLRPLNEKEIVRNEVADWECINSTTILYRNSLQERSGLPTAYSFDRVFRGDSSTREVYDEGIKDIALSVTGGINSTIFAYGQTSSGKTYTMNGITEYTVADIYDYMERHKERAFVLKFSAMEIYNEVVRDLLFADNTALRLLDDPEKGTIIEKLTEETLRDQNHLKELLSICEAQRQTSETFLNETSSRSHQILRLTIESSAREFIGKGNTTTLYACVNFVDLAGSERASIALSVGQRLKEGCHINRSLLTLGTVIRKLSKERHGHVNYRDSKLTRILQPALGGNARTAIICTLSPSRNHVEQSRNTLLFASCAKEVSTNAQVNVVMSDKALVKHLQKEVARLESELRTPGSICDHETLLRKKDTQIEKLGIENKELKKQLDRAHSRIDDLLHVTESYKGLQEIDGVNSVCNRTLDHPPESENSNDNYTSDSISTPGQEKADPLLGSPEVSDGISEEAPRIDLNVLDKDKANELFAPSSSESEESTTMLCESGNAHIFTPSTLSGSEMAEPNETTPPTVLEKIYTGRPTASFPRKQWKIPSVIYGENGSGVSRNDSQSSDYSSFIDDTANEVSSQGDDDIPTLGSFVAGLRELTKREVTDESNAKDRLNDWPFRFEKLQRQIIELWQACNVSLIRRTYFFLLIKGNSSHSIYMEVEHRRLSFIKETFSRGKSALQDCRALTLQSSMKALRKEREMLSRLVYKRCTVEERNIIYGEWGIMLSSKRRSLQLLHRLWSYTDSMDHIAKSAAIVAKLIGFSEHDVALEEMLGLSFARPPPTIQRSFSWKTSMSSIL